MFKLGPGKKKEKREINMKHLLGPWSKKGDCLVEKEKKRKEKYRPLQEGFEPDLLAAFIS